MIVVKQSVSSLLSLAKMEVIISDLPTTALPKSLSSCINAIKCSPGNYKLIKTSRTITAHEGLRLPSNHVIMQLECDLNLGYSCGLLQVVMDKTHLRTEGIQSNSNTLITRILRARIKLFFNLKCVNY